LSTDVSEVRAATNNIPDETSVDNYFTRQYIPEDKPELHTRRRENLKSHMIQMLFTVTYVQAQIVTFAGMECEPLWTDTGN
jgi:hypothetical protein